jgi:hypothetical protein
MTLWSLATAQQRPHDRSQPYALAAAERHRIGVTLSGFKAAVRGRSPLPLQAYDDRTVPLVDQPIL